MIEVAVRRACEGASAMRYPVALGLDAYWVVKTGHHGGVCSSVLDQPSQWVSH